MKRKQPRLKGKDVVPLQSYPLATPADEAALRRDILTKLVAGGVPVDGPKEASEGGKPELPDER